MPVSLRTISTTSSLKTTSKPTTFLKLSHHKKSHHKQIWTTDCLGTVVKIIKVKLSKVFVMNFTDYYGIEHIGTNNNL